MTVFILGGDKFTNERMKKGCEHYGLKFRFNRKTSPYFEIQINEAEDAQSLFWLGANMASPYIDTPILKSKF